MTLRTSPRIAFLIVVLAAFVASMTLCATLMSSNELRAIELRSTIGANPTYTPYQTRCDISSFGKNPCYNASYGDACTTCQYTTYTGLFTGGSGGYQVATGWYYDCGFQWSGSCTTQQNGLLYCTPSQSGQLPGNCSKFYGYGTQYPG